jgi:Fic family protein
MAQANQYRRPGVRVVPGGLFIKQYWDMGGIANDQPADFEAFVPDCIASERKPVELDIASAIEAAWGKIMTLGSNLAVPSLPAIATRIDSVNSSWIEGICADNTAVAAGIEGLGRTTSDILAVINNIHALQWAETCRPTLANILECHRIMCDGTTDDSIKGQLRTAQNWVDGPDPRWAKYVPPPRDYVLPLMEDLERYCLRTDLPVLLQAAVAHAQLETIHPFSNGNGRTGRCLVHMIIRYRSPGTVVPPVSAALAARKTAYIQHLAGWQKQGDREGWVRFSTQCMADTADAAATLGRRLAAIKTIWETRIRQPRQDAAILSVLDTLIANPVISTAQAARGTHRTRQQAGSILRHLQRENVLRQASDSSWPRRWWYAPDVTEAIHQMQASLAP